MSETPAAAARQQALRTIDVWERMNETVVREVDELLPVVEGRVPEELRGVLYRNGPGRSERGGVAYGHYFDGDGMVLRFAFTSEGIRYRNRFVRTREFCEEEAAGVMLHRAFGTNLPGPPQRNLLRLRFKNSANTSVLWHGGRLLALWEGGLPHALDPETLQTLGPHSYEGRLRAAPSLHRLIAGPDLPFGAHPKIDPNNGELHNFGLITGPRSRLLLYRADSGGVMAPPTKVELAGPVFTHDFVLTPRYLVFFLCPVKLAVFPLLLGLVSPASSLRFDDSRPTRILLVPRDGGAPICAKSAPCFIYHFVNGHEDARGQVVVDAMRMQGLSVFPPLRGPHRRPMPPLPRPMLTRYTIDIARHEAEEEILSPVSSELPFIHPGRVSLEHRYVYAVASAPAWDMPAYSGVCKYDTRARTERVRPLAPDIAGEPVFVPRRGATSEDDGWVLITLYRAGLHRTDLLVLDASDLTTVCQASLPHHVPPGFHGTWVECFSPTADVVSAPTHSKQSERTQ